MFDRTRLAELMAVEEQRFLDAHALAFERMCGELIV